MIKLMNRNNKILFLIFCIAVIVLAKRENVLAGDVSLDKNPLNKIMANDKSINSSLEEDDLNKFVENDPDEFGEDNSYDNFRGMKFSSKYISNLSAEYKEGNGIVFVDFDLKKHYEYFWITCVLYKQYHDKTDLYHPIYHITPNAGVTEGHWSGCFENIKESGSYDVCVFVGVYHGGFHWDFDERDYVFRIDVDNDKNKSDFDSHTFMSTQGIPGEEYMDLKGCYPKNSEDYTKQDILVEYQMKLNGILKYNKICTTYLYPRRDLTICEKNSKQTLKWSNSKKIKGNVYLVAYNSEIGSYIIVGNRLANGEIVFPGYMLNESTMISIIEQCN